MLHFQYGRHVYSVTDNTIIGLQATWKVNLGVKNIQFLHQEMH